MKKIHTFYDYCFNDLKIQKKEDIRNALPYIAILSTLSAILQSTGNYIPVIGLFISPFATLPVMFAATISKAAVVFTYCISTILLVFLQPNEFFTFPFTTGLLGLSFGIGLLIVKRRMLIVIVSSLVLSTGIFILFYIFNFPILGPIHADSLAVWTMIVVFSSLYSWIFFDICYYLFKRIFKGSLYWFSIGR
ncbi:hypothetical protein ACOI1C_20590 [Bacillus sp. DJP31]|uniref:hypothetical protein n=1 Tax=Bacillus sp. DJP31 TaxID=3409789 RepID=UPI003BB68A08